MFGLIIRVGIGHHYGHDIWTQNGPHETKPYKHTAPTVAQVPSCHGWNKILGLYERTQKCIFKFWHWLADENTGRLWSFIFLLRGWPFNLGALFVHFMLRVCNVFPQNLPSFLILGLRAPAPNRLSAFRYTVILIYCYTDLLLHWSTGILLYRYTVALIYWYTGILLHWYTDIQVYWSTGILLHWYTGILIYSHTDLQVYCCLHKCPLLQFESFSSVGCLYALLLKDSISLSLSLSLCIVVRWLYHEWVMVCQGTPPWFAEHLG